MKKIFAILGMLSQLLFSCGEKKEISKVENTTEKVENDKIILVQGADEDLVKKALMQFKNLYPNEHIHLKINKLEQKKIIITFPTDIKFTHFCFLVNYLHYPENIFYKAEIKAWATTPSESDLLNSENTNQKVMIFIPERDTDYDNVYMITEKNIGYKIGFSINDQHNISMPEHYTPNPINFSEIENTPSEEIKESQN